MRLWNQVLENAIIVVAPAQCGVEQILECTEFSQLECDAITYGLQSPSFRITRGVTGIVSSQRVDDLVERQAERLQTTYQPNPVDSFGQVDPVSGRSPRGNPDEAPAFVVANRIHGDIGERGQIPDFHFQPLTLDHTQDFSLALMTNGDQGEDPHE